MPRTKAVVAYVPVVQQGYINLLKRHPDANLYILDSDVIKEFGYLRKDIRALAPAETVKAVGALKLVKSVQLADKATLQNLREELVIMPQDDLAAELSSKYLGGKTIKLEPVFLRWDRDNSTANQEVEPDAVIASGDFENKIIGLLYAEGAKATSWWRRVGVAIIKAGKVILSAHNQNMPTQYSSFIDGDPRSALNRGVGIEFTNDAHAEATMIARAARDGIALRGSSIYVDTFPCPKCAKDIVNAGIKECYYVSGYAVTDALSVMHSAGIKVIKIDTNLRPPKGPEAIPYPEK